MQRASKIIASTREMSTNTKRTIQKKERNIHSKNKSRVCFQKILTVKIALSRPNNIQIFSQVFFCIAVLAFFIAVLVFCFVVLMHVRF